MYGLTSPFRAGSTLFAIGLLSIGLCPLFCADSATQGGTVIHTRLTLDGKRPLRPNVYGVNCELFHRPFTHLQPGFMQKCLEADRPFFRYPAGTGANYFNPLTGFLKGDVKNFASLNEKFKQMFDGKGYDTSEFFEFARKTGTDYSLVLNMSTVSVDENRQWLERIARMGARPKYFELGNELHFGQYSEFFENGRAYASHCEKTARMIREIFPEARIGVVISSLYYISDSFLREDIKTSEQRHREWSEALKGKGFYDAVVFHMYTRWGMPADIKPKDAWPFDKTYLYTISYLDQNFNKALDAVGKDFPGKAVWVTEYHTMSFSMKYLKDYAFSESYLGSMHTTLMTLDLFARPEVELGNRHSFVKFITWPNDKIVNGRLPKDAAFGINNQYRHFTIIGPAVRNSTDFLKPTVEGVSEYKRVVDGGLSPEVQAGYFCKGDRGYLILINKMGRTYTLDGILSQSGAKETPAQWTAGLQLAPRKDIALEKALADANEMSSAALNGAQAQTVSLPPYSVTRLEVQTGQAK